MTRINFSKLSVLKVRCEGNWAPRKSDRPMSPYEFLLDKWKSFEEEMTKARAMKNGPLRWKGSTQKVKPENPAEVVPKMFQTSPLRSMRSMQVQSSKTLDCILFDKSVADSTRNRNLISTLFPPLNAQAKSTRNSLEQTQRKSISTAPKIFRYDEVSAAIRAHNRRQIATKPTFIKPSRPSQTDGNQYEKLFKISKSDKMRISSKPPVVPMKSKTLDCERKMSKRAVKSSSRESGHDLTKPAREVSIDGKPPSRNLSSTATASHLFKEVEIEEKKSIATSSANNFKVDEANMNAATATDLFGSSDRPGAEFTSPAPSVAGLPSEHQHSLYTEEMTFPTRMDAVKSHYQRLDDMCRECTALYPVPHTQKSLPTPTMEAVIELRRRLQMRGPICLESPLVSIHKISGSDYNYSFAYNKDFR